MQLPALTDDAVEKVAKFRRMAVIRGAAQQFHAAVDIPAENQNGVACLGYGFPDGAIVVFPIDQKSHLFGSVHTPAVTAGLEQAG